MEFSFDRSKNSNLNSQQAKPTPQNNSAPDEIDTSTIANERLRKAIERNRARQKDRDQQQPRMSPEKGPETNVHQTAWAQHQTQAGVHNPREEVKEHVQESLFNQRTREPRPEAKEANSQQENYHQSNSHHANNISEEHGPRVERIKREPPLMASRRTVARPDDTEFAPVKRPTKKVASQISYTTGNRRKAKEIDPKLVNYLVKGSWFFCSFLVLRLIFANGGVVDYFSQKNLLNNRFTELSRIKKENMSLVQEIERMQLDVGYQKKLVRDNLGFIAQDEYLILFPKD